MSLLFFFKQKTAYEMRISDWSSDVCSSDLEYITQTFGFEEMPDAVDLETATFRDLGDGRTEVDVLAVVFTMEARAGMLASGMDVGINEGYAKLDEKIGRASCRERVCQYV